jgi:DNA mismatch repair ATPase MutS
MKIPSLDEFIESLNLSHVDVPYDPAKRREYYLRTRQLRGRKTGQAMEIFGEKPKRSVSTTPPKKANADSKQSDFQAKMDALNARLDKLKTVLAELTKQAQARSGVDPAGSSSSTDSKSSTATPPKKLTAKQKADKAKKAKENADKKANQTPSQQLKELESKIKAIQAEIKKMKAEIAAAKKKKKPSTHKTGSVGAGGFTIHD